jgi:sugar lactone lactonase YvrE/PKD repeat protein
MKPFIFGILLLFSVSLNAQIITTVAGGIGDGLNSKNTSINQIQGIAFDSAGNIYISDQKASVIRKISAKTGIITTVIGNGIAGFSGDGVQAILASINSPTGIVFDRFGNLYFADYGNFRIRKVNVTSGVISTIAGTGINDSTGNNGPASSARIGYVTNLALDSLGNIYFGDDNVRMINASNGIISKIKSGRTNGIALDGLGNLYTSSGSTLDKTNLTTGLRTIVFSLPFSNIIGDLAIDNFSNLYFSVSYPSNAPQIKKMVLNTGITSVAAGNGNLGFSGDDSLATMAKFSNCTELVVDKKGDFYFSDVANYNIRKVTLSSGIINTIAGNGCYGGDGSSANSAFLNNPNDVAIDGFGNIFIADTYNNRIRKINATTGIISTIAGYGIAGFNGDSILASVAYLNNPTDIALDSFGNIYFVDQRNNRIRKIEKASGRIITVAGDGLSGFSADGVSATSSKLNSPSSMCLDSFGNIYISDSYNNRIRKVSASTGIITTIAGIGTMGFSGDGNLATLAKLSFPGGIAVDKLGNIFFLDIGNNRIRKISKASGIITTIAGNGTMGYNGDSILTSSSIIYVYGNIEINNSGDIFICDNNRIRKITASIGLLTTIAGNGNYGFSGDGGLPNYATLRNPNGVTFDNSGNFYFAESIGNRIRKVSNQLEFDFTSNTYFPQRPDTVSFSTSFKDSASYFEWSITPNTFEYLVGTNLNSAQPKVRFSKMGLYNIKLKVVYHGDTLTKNKLNYIAVSNPLLQNMDFNSNTNNATYLETVSFTVLFNDTPASIHWSFEPKTVVYLSGTDSSSLQPKLRFTQNGNYSVKLELSYLGDTLVKTKPNYITISSPLPPPLDFTTNNRTPQIFDTVYLKALFTDSIRFYQWSILPKLDYLYIQGTDSSSAQPKIKFTNFGKSYDVTLKIGFYNDTLSKIMLSYFYVTNKVGIAENIANDTYTIYPNPTHSNVLIETETPIENQLQCMVYDALGNLLNTHALSNLKTEITLPDPTGLYLIKILKPDGNFLLKKVIKEE